MKQKKRKLKATKHNIAPLPPQQMHVLKAGQKKSIIEDAEGF